MRKLLILSAMIVGTSLYACPDLDGRWVCEENIEETLTLEQSVNADGITVYDNGEEAIVADGEWHNMEDGTKVKMTCLSDKELEINQIDGDETMDSIFTLNSANFMIQVFSISSPEFGDSEFGQSCMRF